MLHLVKTTNLIIKRTPLVGGILFAAVLALLPISAGAQCAKWDASGYWEIRQRGQHHPIKLDLQQTGKVLNGSASHVVNSDSFFKVHTNIASVDGTIDGDSLSIQIYWPGGLIGVYNGRVRPSGRLEGEGYEKASPNVRHIWHSQGVLKCLPPPPSPPAAPKVIKSSGKRKVTPNPVQTSQPAPPPMKVPGIVASQVIFPFPNAATGFVVLQWDAGPDHPYAEVWFKINGSEQIFLVELGKGVRQVMVERGKLYQYILTDAGKTLSTVSFVAH